MSFNLTKIKQFVKINNLVDFLRENESDIVLIISIILIALISFGAGRLTAPKLIQSPITIENNGINSPNAAISQSFEQLLGENNQAGGGAKEIQSTQDISMAINSQNGKFVASKNSKYYHWPWSPWAKNIKPANQVWFNSEQEAQGAGYTRASNFIQLAPAGYSQ